MKPCRTPVPAEWWSAKRLADLLKRAQRLGMNLERGSELENWTIQELEHEVVRREARGMEEKHARQI